MKELLPSAPTEGGIPASVCARLPQYYRLLRALLGADILRIRSSELANRLDLKPSTVRRDLSFLGGVGQQGYGYNVKDLYSAVGNALGVMSHYSAVLVLGSNRLAAGLAGHPALFSRGITLRAVFGPDSTDAIPTAADMPERLPMEQLTAYCRRESIAVGILATDKSEAAMAAAALAAGGVRGILNLTCENVGPFEGVRISDAFLGDRLLALCCEIHQQKEEDLL